MSVKASATITLSTERDIESYWRFYTLQSSTLSKPEKPTSFPPSSGISIEYNGGSTDGFDVFEEVYYRVSDKVLTYDELIGGAMIEIVEDGGVEKVEIDASFVFQAYDPPLIIVSQFAVIVLEDFEKDGLSAKKGTYFLIDKEEGVWVSKLSYAPKSAITWDGNAEGMESAADIMFKVSELLPSKEDLIGQTVKIHTSDGEGLEFQITSETLTVGDGATVVLYEDSLAIIIVSEETPELIEMGLSKGMWFWGNVAGDKKEYVSSLTIPGDSSNWSDAEPTYTTGSTDSLYYVDATVFSDGSFSYSEVSLSSSYEAAKRAYNEAVNAGEMAEEAAKTATNFINYTSSDGLIVGNKNGGSWSGYRSQLLPNAFNILDANGAVLASYGADTISLGKNSQNATIEMCGGLAKVWYGKGLFDENDILKIESESIELAGKSAYLHSQYNSPNNRYNVLVGAQANNADISVGLEVQNATHQGAWHRNYFNLSTVGIESLVDRASIESRNNAELIAGNVILLNAFDGCVLMGGENRGLYFSNDTDNFSTSKTCAVHMDKNGNIGFGYGLQNTGKNSVIYGNSVTLDASALSYLSIDGNQVLRLGMANADGHYMFRPVDDGVTALGSTSQRWETVNAMILRSYDESTTSSGVYARIYSNRIYRYSSSSRRYKEDIKPIESAELNPRNLYDAEVVQFKYKDGYLIDEDMRAGKEIPGFIVEDLEKIYPIAIDYNDDGSAEMWNANILIPAMLNLIQEQNERLKKLEGKE